MLVYLIVGCHLVALITLDEVVCARFLHCKIGIKRYFVGKYFKTM